MLALLAAIAAAVFMKVPAAGPIADESELRNHRDMHRSIHATIDIRATIVLVVVAGILGDFAQSGTNVATLHVWMVRFIIVMNLLCGFTSVVSLAVRIGPFDHDMRRQLKMLEAISRRKAHSFNASIVLLFVTLTLLGVKLGWF